MSANISTECFTSRNGTSAKMRKAREMTLGQRGIAPCPWCGTECGRDRPELGNHMHRQHAGADETGISQSMIDLRDGRQP